MYRFDRGGVQRTCLVVAVFLFMVPLSLAQDHSPEYDMILPCPANSSTGITRSWSGYLWVTDSGTDTIYRIDPDTGVIRETISAPCSNPQGITYGNDDPRNPGTLWVVCGSNAIYTLSLSNGNIRGRPAPDGDLVGITLDPLKTGSDYHVWVVDREKQMIKLIDSSGRSLRSFPSPFPNPTGLSWQGTWVFHDSYGLPSDLWVSSEEPGIVAKINATDGSVIYWIELESEHISGLCVSEPYLWVIDQDRGLIGRINIRTVSFRGLPISRTGEEPFTVSFEERTMFGGYRFVADAWLWNFGDGVRGTGPNPVHTYLQEGNYTVSLVIINGPDTYFGQEVRYIEVMDRDPRAQFRIKPGTPKNGPPPLTITFEEFSWSYDGIIGRLWEFGDGSESREANATHTYSQPGIYNISLTVFEADGDSDRITRQGYVIVPESWLQAIMLIMTGAYITRRNSETKGLGH